MIRLVTVVGHGQNLIEHFIQHYEKYVDEINIVVYVSDIAPNLEQEVKDRIQKYNNVKIFSVIIDRVFDWNKVTQLYNSVKYAYPNDWWVVADIDELQLYPNDDLKSLVNECDENNWDLVRGGFIDRIGVNGEFSEIKSNVSLWRQFPNAGFFRYPMSGACPNKVCVMKGYIEITPGQHYAKINDQTTWRWQGWNHPLIAPYEMYSVQVHHFKWDSTAIERIKEVADVKKEYSFSEEYSKMYEELKKTDLRININREEFMFEQKRNKGEFQEYKQWNKLIKKIIAI